MTFKFKRGLSTNLPPASQVEVGAPLFTTDDGKLHVKMDSGEYSVIGSGPPSDLGISDVTGLQDALDLKVDLDDLPQDANNVIDIARQSTLQDFIADFPVDGDGNLDIARESTLETFDATVTSVQSGLSALQYLPAFFTNDALPSTPTSTGFLQYDLGTDSWNLLPSTATAPDEINGGNAASYSD